MTLSDALNKLKISLPPLPTSPPTHAPDTFTLKQMAIVIALALFFHFQIASIEIAVFSCVIFLFKCLLIWRGKTAPSQWLVMILTVASVALIIVAYGGWNGQTAGISFLVLLVSLKFLESQTVRDYFVVCIILYFLAASSFLFNATLPSIGLVIAYTIAITALLFKITNPALIPTGSALKDASFIIAKAVPLALFLFFFFPRVSGNFGFLPSLDRDTNSLDGSLVAGDMASGAFSTELAFKVEFEGEIPPISTMYWRAKVMTDELNFAWKIADATVPKLDVRLPNEGPELERLENRLHRYTILHEPTTDTFLPYLDYIAEPGEGTLLQDHTVRLASKKNGTFSYNGVSVPEAVNEQVSIDTSTLLQTERSPSGRVQALISSIRQNSRSDLDIANGFYNHFRDNEFNYSLSPPPLVGQSLIDDFLFNKKTGYCEHYASAFTTLLRWSGIQSRVVVGYHGGTVNRAGNFVEVRYSDAHAWSEALIDGQWVRFDPTAAISPERIEYGMGALRELWDNNLLGSNATGTALSEYLNPTGTARLWRNLSDTWSNVQFQWKKWVVEYDFETQQELLAKIGLNAKNSLVTLVGVLVSGVMLIMLVYFWQLIPKQKRRDDIQKLYANYLKKAKRAGIEIEISDTPNDLAKKITRQYPESEKHIQNITGLFNSIRFGRIGDASDSKSELKQNISRLKLQN